MRREVKLQIQITPRSWSQKRKDCRVWIRAQVGSSDGKNRRSKIWRYCPFNTVHKLTAQLKILEFYYFFLWYLLPRLVFFTFYEIKSKELKKKCHEAVFTMSEHKRIKLCRISWLQKSRNSTEFNEFRNTEFCVIPRNLGQFCILYGINGILKKTCGILY